MPKYKSLGIRTASISIVLLMTMASLSYAQSIDDEMEALREQIEEMQLQVVAMRQAFEKMSIEIQSIRKDVAEAKNSTNESPQKVYKILSQRVDALEDSIDNIALGFIEEESPRQGDKDTLPGGKTRILDLGSILQSLPRDRQPDRGGEWESIHGKLAQEWYIEKLLKKKVAVTGMFVYADGDTRQTMVAIAGPSHQVADITIYANVMGRVRSHDALKASRLKRGIPVTIHGFVEKIRVGSRNQQVEGPFTPVYSPKEYYKRVHIYINISDSQIVR